MNVCSDSVIYSKRVCDICLKIVQVTMAYSMAFCVVCEAQRHIGITLSVVCLSVCPSVCLFVCHTFLSHFPKLCFAGDTCIPRNAATIFVFVKQTSMSPVPTKSEKAIFSIKVIVKVTRLMTFASFERM